MLNIRLCIFETKLGKDYPDTVVMKNKIKELLKAKAKDTDRISVIALFYFENILNAQRTPYTARPHATR